jgi:hypothetical protein
LGKFKTYILVLIGFLSFNYAVSQSIYQTQKADMTIKAICNDSSILEVKSSEVLILLNYQDASFTIKMDKSTFKTGIDSLDKKLKLLKYDIITFKGELGIDYINTNDDTPPDFTVEGVLSTNSKIIKGTGNLIHTSSRGRYSGILTLSFIVEKDDLGIDLTGLDLEDEVHIEIIEVVLNPITEQ